MSWMTCSASSLRLSSRYHCVWCRLRPRQRRGPTPKPVVFRNATLHTGTGDKPIPDAVMMVKDGKIEAVGAKGDVGRRARTTPKQIDLAGAVIIPGLVDTHSHIGIWSRPGVPAQRRRQRR